ncbi:outer membrane lipoprotein-sorting protein [Candidatus Deferrimicrobium sp.]|uniref:outer membrane lipoprotein-sorting protein n=1 Tax=Candidatus Deferrimicrobium sp. TaxID=3060586 RepID=UPI00271BF148|nr:outer membrane lipoprotein-sorting protein [Candidatus Deferrimicrobium sp.]MDO8739769.1 outer membrane lipoprotein-sorting protein [Candidatus Deferrimicrobium sp.]
MAKRCFVWISAVVLLFPLIGGLFSRAFAGTPGEAEEIMRRSALVQFYSGNDMKSKVTMRLLSKEGGERVRELIMTRRNVKAGGDQKYFILFRQPADVRDMTFLVWKYPQRDSDRWLYIPAIKLVKRIAANDKRSSFVGSDFSYEDVSGRAAEEDNHTLLREEKYGGKEVLVIKSVPKDEKSADFGYKVSWIDKGNFVLWKEEYYDKRGALFKVFTADEVKPIQGFPTTVKRTMKNVQTGHWTEAAYGEVKYNLGLADGVFSERSLRNPPKELAR